MELAIVLIVILFIIISTVRFKLHPVLSLTIAAIASGFFLGMNTKEVMEHIANGFGKTLSGIGLVIAFGWELIIFFLIHNLFGWLQLTSANYIEHYGLLRAKKPNGKYERCQPFHSWNANHFVSNLLLFQLQRHSDHHANASRSYQCLRSLDKLPELPTSYMGMYMLAYLPPLWFKVMDKRLLAVPHIDGDLSKVNMDPSKEAELRAKYA